MADDSGIDPRYAAQFQRGFDPSVHVAPPPERPAGPVRVSGDPARSAERVPDPPRFTPPREAPAAAAPAIEDSPVEPPTPTGFDRQLGILGGAFVVIGLLVAAQAVGSAVNAESYDQGVWVFSRAASLLPGPLLAAGLVLLAVAALPWLGAGVSRARLTVLPGAALGVLVAGGAVLAVVADLHGRAQAYWTTGNPSIEQYAEIERAGRLVEVTLAVTPWITLVIVVLVVLAARVLRAARQREASASATASREA